MKNCKKTTLIPIIQKYVEKATHIDTEEYRTYFCLPSLGFQPRFVNHSRSYVNPVNQEHTQGIEISWVDAKLGIKSLEVIENYYKGTSMRLHGENLNRKT